MNLQEFKFPEYALGTNQLLLKEAEQRGFTNRNNKYVKFFNQLFFNGGEIIWKKDINFDMKNYLFDFMTSWKSNHEDKSAICAMLLSELVDDVKEIQKTKTEKEIDEILF